MNFRSVAAAACAALMVVTLPLTGCGGANGADTPGIVNPDPALPSPPPAIAVGSVSVTLLRDTVIVREETSARAELKSAAGAVLTGRAIVWRSSEPTVATVDSTGRVITVGEGTAVISATSEGQSGSAIVTVRPVPVASVTITGAFRQKVGDTYAMSAVVRAADGSELMRPVSWRVSDTARASITTNGAVTSRTLGAFLVEAGADGRTWGRGIETYDWFSSVSPEGASYDALLWSDNAMPIDENTGAYQLFGASCVPAGDFYVYVSLYGATAQSGDVQYAFDDDAPVREAWQLDDDGKRTLFLGGSNASKLAFADRMATARRFTMSFAVAGGATRTQTWRVTGFASRLAAIAPGCRAE